MQFSKMTQARRLDILEKVRKQCTNGQTANFIPFGDGIALDVSKPGCMPFVATDAQVARQYFRF